MTSLRRWLKFLVWGSAITFLVLAWIQLVSGSQEWASAVENLDAGGFVFALVVLFAAHACLPTLGYLNHTDFGYDIDAVRAYRFWFLSQLAKYIPGGIWQMTTKVVLYRENGMPTTVAAASMVWELIVILTGAMTVGLLGLYALPTSLHVPAAGAIVIVIALGLFSMFTFVWQAAHRSGVRLRVVDNMLAMYQTVGRARWTLFVKQYLVVVFSWGLMGISFTWLVGALKLPDSPPVTALTGIFALSWAIGFVVVISPGGVGPREAAITAMLAPYVGLETAFTIALLSRLQWTVAEGIHLVITGVLGVYGRRRVTEHE